MTGRCWHLLAAFSLMVVCVSPALSRGQEVAPEGPFAIKPGVTSSAPQLSWHPPPVPMPTPVVPHPVPLNPGTGLHYLVQAAGIIFSGRVTFVGRPESSRGPGSGLNYGPGSRPNLASTVITFQVEHAIRGCSQGQNLTIHEWAGLWASGERYRIGERVFLFLYAPSKLGLTSPVSGALGRLAFDAHDRIIMNALHVANLAADFPLRGSGVVPYPDFELALLRFARKD